MEELLDATRMLRTVLPAANDSARREAMLERAPYIARTAALVVSSYLDIVAAGARGATCGSSMHASDTAALPSHAARLRVVQHSMHNV